MDGEIRRHDEGRGVMPNGWTAHDNPPHCCLECGFVPVEGMLRYLQIHGDKADCVSCGAKLPCAPPWQDNPVDAPEPIPQFFYKPVTDPRPSPTPEDK